MSEKEILLDENTILELGDIIEIQDKKYYVNYVDETKLKAINIEKPEHEEVIFFTSIEQVTLLYRDERKGFARQHDLLPNTWINIKFDEDVPIIITGEITNLEEDMIEITTYNSKMFKEGIIYIDFAYKGLPEDLPIEYIQIRKKPYQAEEVVLGEEVGETKEERMVGETKEERMVGETKEERMVGETKEEEERTVGEPVDYIAQADIVFGNELASITQFVNVDVSQQRYNIDTQTNDFLENMISKLTFAQKKPDILNNIQKTINRFIQLRREYSTYDIYGNIKTYKELPPDWHPLAENMETFKTVLYWILPVVLNTKKIYDIEDDSADHAKLITELHDVVEIIEKYRNASVDEHRYEKMITQLDEHFTPFHKGALMTKAILSEIPVSKNTTVIADGIQSVKGDGLSTNPFYMDTYIPGLTSLKTTSPVGMKAVSVLSQLTEPDKMRMYSIMTLPESVIRFSHVNLPQTNLYNKSNLHGTFVFYSKLLNNKTAVSSVDVTDFAVPLEFTNTYASGITNYKMTNLNPDSKMDISEMSDKDIYKYFLNMIVPGAEKLVEIMDKYNTGNLSFYNVVSLLEPFLIYTKDITHKQSREIVEYLKIKIKLYAKEYDRKYNIFKLLNRYSLNASRKEPISIFELLNSKYVWDKIDNEKLASVIIRGGAGSEEEAEEEDGVVVDKKEGVPEEEPKKKPKKGVTFAEFIKSSKPVSSRKFSAPVPLPIMSMLPEITFEENNIKADAMLVYNQPKHTTSEILKHMILLDFGNLFHTGMTIGQMHLMLSEDINAILTTDRNDLQLPSTNCETKDIAKRYTSMNQLEQDNGVDVFYDKEYDKTPYEMMDALQHKPATEILAALTKELVKKYKYSASSAHEVATAILNKKKLVKNGAYAILNADESVYYKRENNKWVLERDGDCDTLDLNKAQMKKKLINQLLDQFDERYAISKIELEEMLKTKYVYFKNIITKLMIIAYGKKYGYMDEQYKIGLQLLEMENGEGIVISPYKAGLDIILGQQDFAKKNSDILQFVGKFTREPLENTEDNMNWLYCTKTNTKLMPVFKKELAKVFAQNPDKYNEKLDEIIQSNGVLLEDGDAIVDKHSGWKIRDIDFATDEGYDAAGFKIVSKGELEKDATDFILEQSKNMTPEVKIISNIIHAFSENMGISFPQITKEFIINLASSTFSTMLSSKEIYDKKAAEAALRGKKTPPYAVTYNTYIMYLTMGSLLIGIQTSIPSLKTKKTFPGCVKSFSGFPLDGVGDESSVDYFVCAAYKMKSSVQPWASLTNEASIKKILVQMINEKLLPNLDVKHRMDTKRAYLVTAPNEAIPDDHNINKWTSFLPPLQAFKVKPYLLQNLSTDFLKPKDKNLVIESKILTFSLAIQEKIHNVIKDKTLVLTNMANEPFLENSCCLETQTNIMKYFRDEDPQITQLNNLVRSLSEILGKSNAYMESAFLYSAENTKKKLPQLLTAYSEETIYKGFITICKFSSSAQLPPDLLTICSKKPEMILSKNDTLPEKIIRLKKMGFNYDTAQFNRLMQYTAKQGIVNMYADEVIFQENRFKDVLQIKQTTLSEILVKAMDTGFKEEAVLTCKNFFIKHIREMKEGIYEFLLEFGKNATKKALLRLKTMLMTIATFTDIDTQNVVQFLKNSILNMLTVYPAIICNNANHSSINIPTYLNLSAIHISEIKKHVAEFYEDFKEFYSNPVLAELLKDIVANKNEELLMKETTIFEKDPELTMMMWEFNIYKIFTYYIKLTDAKYTKRREEEEGGEEEEEEEEEALYGSQIGLKRSVANLLTVFIESFTNQKNKINNLSYDKIMNIVIMTKETEKDTFTDMLKKMTVAERQTDTMLKVNKLGKWNAGLQKGLTQYVKEVYDDEMEKMADIIDVERKMLDKYKDEQLSGEDYDELDRKRRDNELDEEAYDMTGLSPDYEDGNYDNDDQEYADYD